MSPPTAPTKEDSQNGTPGDERINKDLYRNGEPFDSDTHTCLVILGLF